MCLGGLRTGYREKERESESGMEEHGGGRVVVENELRGGERVIDGGWGKQG